MLIGNWIWILLQGLFRSSRGVTHDIFFGLHTPMPPKTIHISIAFALLIRMFLYPQRVSTNENQKIHHIHRMGTITLDGRDGKGPIHQCFETYPQPLTFMINHTFEWSKQKAELTLDDDREINPDCIRTAKMMDLASTSTPIWIPGSYIHFVSRSWNSWLEASSGDAFFFCIRSMASSYSGRWEK